MDREGSQESLPGRGKVESTGSRGDHLDNVALLLGSRGSRLCGAAPGHKVVDINFVEPVIYGWGEALAAEAPAVNPALWRIHLHLCLWWDLRQGMDSTVGKGASLSVATENGRLIEGCGEQPG